MPQLFKKLLLGICLLATTCFSLELAVRFSGYSERYIYDPIYAPFNQAEDIPYVHKPNLVNVRARGLAIIHTDSLGLRAKMAGAEYSPKENNSYRIAIIGDSVTFGEGINRTEDTFSQVLEDQLNQMQSNVRVQVFNYGVSAYSVKEMAATLRYRVLDLEPDLVLMAIIPQDFDLSRTPDAVDQWGYHARSSSSPLIPRNSSIKRALRKVRLLYLLRDTSFWLSSLQDAQHGLAKDDLPESYQYVKRFTRIAEEYNLPYVIVLLPTYDDDLLKALSAQLDLDEITFLDLSSLRNEFTLNQFKASWFDWHPSVMVHRRIGDVLAEYILQGQIPSKKYNEHTTIHYHP